jgi:hypothetical protein
VKLCMRDGALITFDNVDGVYGIFATDNGQLLSGIDAMIREGRESGRDQG